MRVRQVLLTYFNRRFYSGFTKALDDEWLKYRWKLFNTFTGPSICAQTCIDFDWVILYHDNSPKWLKECAESLEMPCRMRPSFNSIDPAGGKIDPGLDDLKDSSFDVVLTTRIDSDDALHRCAMAKIRESFEGNPDAYDILNFEVGFQYDCLSQRLAMVKLASPPFDTKINRSPVVNPLDVGGVHSELPEKYRYRDISQGHPMFLQVVHGDNIINRMSSRAIYLSRSLSQYILKEAFNIDDPIREMPLRVRLSDMERLTRQMRRTIVASVKESIKHGL